MNLTGNFLKHPAGVKINADCILYAVYRGLLESILKLH